MGHSIDGVELAAQADFDALKAEVDALKAAPASVGPAGPSGPQGPKGDPGPAGKDGAQAPASIDDFLAALKALLLNGSAPATSGAGQAPAVDYFPADPGSAPFPSPEGASSLVLNGKVSGKPYLRNSAGDIYCFAGDGMPLTPFQSEWTFYVNGAAMQWTCSMLLAAQGQVYVKYNGGLWGLIQSPGVISRESPPTAGTAGSQYQPAPPAPVVAPAAPAPFTAWTGITVLFGDNQTLKTMQQAHDAPTTSPGDTLLAGPEMIGKTVAQTLKNSKPIKIDLGGRLANGGMETPTWTPGMMLDASPLNDPDDYPHQLGAISPDADIEIWGADITEFGMKEGGSGGTAAIRPNSACNIKVRHCKLWKNQNGLGPNYAVAHTFDLADCWLLDNGLGDGRSHNTYFASGCVSAVIGPRVTSIQTNGGGGGHAIKSRAFNTKFIAPGFFAAWDAADIDIPNGSASPVVLDGVTLVKKAGAANHAVVTYGVENLSNGAAGVSGSGTVFDLECDSPFFLGAPYSFDAACKWVGNKPSGLPA